MSIMLQLREDVALEVQREHNHPNTTLKKQPKTEQLISALTKFGVKLTPVHPNQTHPLLVSQFMIESTDTKTNEQILNCLQNFDIVEASYISPKESLP